MDKTENITSICDALDMKGGPEALVQWRALEREMEPLQRGAALFPAAALRTDLGGSLSSPCLSLDCSIILAVVPRLHAPRKTWCFDQRARRCVTGYLPRHADGSRQDLGLRMQDRWQQGSDGMQRAQTRGGATPACPCAQAWC